jgi:zinc transporter ZupT
MSGMLENKIMIAETFFYVSGTIFFFLSIAILAVTLFYLVRFFQAVFAVKTKIEKIAEEVASKTAAFSFGLASITSLLEKMAHPKRKKQEKSEDKKKQ